MTTTDDHDQSGTEVERGPNGIPYVDEERFSIAGWESGDYCLTAARDDGDTVVINFTPNQMRGLQDQIEDMRREHEGLDDE